jgi:hypothetical protein
MSDGYEAAKGQRNFLERLGDKIPGYSGFQNRELRRDVDRLQRDHLSAELARLQGIVQARVRAFTDAGRIGALSGFVRLDRELDGLSQAIKFSDYGASGLFDPVKIGEAELDRLYQFDLGILEDVAALELAINALPGARGTEPNSELENALENVASKIQGLDRKWKNRKQVISTVVASAPSA